MREFVQLIDVKGNEIFVATNEIRLLEPTENGCRLSFASSPSSIEVQHTMIEVLQRAGIAIAG